MKFIVGLLLCAASGFLIGKTNFPWWTFAPACLLIGLILRAGYKQSFFFGFFGMGLIWLVSLLFINASNDGILASRLVQVIPLKTPIVLIIVNSLLAALIGGSAANAGNAIRSVFYSPKKRR